MNSRPVAGENQEMGFTQSRDHTFAQLCNIFATGSPAAILIIGGSNNQTEVIDLATAGAESCVSSVLEPHNRDYEGNVNIRLKWADRDTFCQHSP